jgi:hypothetical protein
MVKNKTRTSQRQSLVMCALTAPVSSTVDLSSHCDESGVPKRRTHGPCLQPHTTLSVL